MKRFIFMLFVVLFLAPQPLFASEISSNPQYIVINFSDSFHFLNWTASEKEWQEEVKPKAVERLRRIKALLTMGTENRKLAWSTLMEYMNYPLDNPSDSSPYVVRMKRILELAETEDLPVFTPLNGVQWWDELPELWNWWDKDGNQTPGCTNDDYEKCGFKKLQNPQYRKRFIAGYNPDNKWNVDWQDWTTPEKFAVRNWGGGDILVAPSPNLAHHTNVSLSFRSVQDARYKKLLETIHAQLIKWKQEKKEYLFAGLSIGTEITLNGALIPGDENFKPFGYRAVQDMFCPPINRNCGSSENWTYADITAKRESIIHTYVQDLAYSAFIIGFPKQRVYSHVWSEAEPGELRYMNAIGASVNYFSQPGMSIYGKALDPLSLSILSSALAENGYQAWAAPEFAPLNRDQESWHTALQNILNNEKAPAKLIDIYNETDILNTPAIPELRNILSEKIKKPSCLADNSFSLIPNKVTNPSKLVWKSSENSVGNKKYVILWKKNTIPDTNNKTQIEYEIKNNENKFHIPPALDPGYYYWSIKEVGCDKNQWTISTPQIFYISMKLKDYPIPWWVQLIQKKPSD